MLIIGVSTTQEWSYTREFVRSDGHVVWGKEKTDLASPLPVARWSTHYEKQSMELTATKGVVDEDPVRLPGGGRSRLVGP